MRTFITGDIHREIFKIVQFCDKLNLKKGDVLILLGDVGVNYYLNKSDSYVKQTLSDLPVTIIALRGNHEYRPRDAKNSEYVLKSINKNGISGTFEYEEKYPKLLFVNEMFPMFTVNNRKYIGINGAYSVDKHLRQKRGYMWNEYEQLTEVEKEVVEDNIKENDNDNFTILSHTCPLKYEPIEMFLATVDQSKVDKSMEIWLDGIEDNTKYDKWYCGHYHIDKKIDDMVFMYNDFIEV